MIFTRQEKLAIIFISACALIGAGFLNCESKNAPLSPAEARPESTPQEKTVNINTASVRELMSLKRIGPVLAERVVIYREENGAFLSREDIKKVKGIGEHTYSLIEERITVE